MTCDLYSVAFCHSANLCAFAT